MRIEFNAGQVHLRRGQLLSIRDGHGGTVCCRAGSIWITEEDQGRDVHLGPGACHSLSARGLAVVQALGESDIALA